MVGGGVATFDCSGDGFPDMLLAGGEVPAKFYRNTSTRGGPLHFELQKSGLELDKVVGAYPIDIDGDGITDLVLLRVGEIVLMRGLGDCKFERANEKWGFNGAGLPDQSIEAGPNALPIVVPLYLSHGKVRFSCGHDTTAEMADLGSSGRFLCVRRPFVIAQ
jgi:hypothetical protein